MAHNKINVKLIDDKISKSIRNSKKLHKAINNAIAGKKYKDIETQKGMDLLKVNEIFTIRRRFSIGKHAATDKAGFYYQLFKEVFYIDNPGKEYVEEAGVKPTVYRRIAVQTEAGDREWAETLAKHIDAELIDEDSFTDEEEEEEA